MPQDGASLSIPEPNETFTSPLFELHKAADRLEIVHPECGHDFPDEIRERSYRILEEQLRK
ncbi:MAG TPA: hypothetical protein VGO90_11180 [Chthoniobacteraceae bacterium]|jgi:hypothetical protein|nr:hypothetical protein [Chthoniobacteraceae bacterium]